MKKPLILGFYGKSNTGKTTLISQLIINLTKEGLNIASVKITDKNIIFDTAGKDTSIHADAGSNLIILSSGEETDYIIKQKHSINKIIENICKFGEVDIILIEGANDNNTPKIRIGDIQIRENTIMTYDNDFDSLIKMVKKMINMEE